MSPLLERFPFPLAVRVMETLLYFSTWFFCTVSLFVVFRYRLRPFRLRGIDSSDTSVEIFGNSYNFPVCFVNSDDVTNNVANKIVKSNGKMNAFQAKPSVRFFYCGFATEHEEVRARKGQRKEV